MDKLWQVWQISCTAERDSLIFSRDIFDASTFCSSSKFYSPTKSRTSQITNFDMYSFRAAQLFLLFEQIYAAALLRKTTAGANAIQQLAEQLPRGVTRELFQSFSICGSCNTWKRFGEENDGGYLLCMDSLNASDLKAAYSMGVQKHDQFSLDVYKAFNVPVFQYDCTVSHPAQICDRCQFFPACLSSKFPGKTSWTLKEAIEQSKMLDVPDRSLLMKMDIERGEWPTLLEADISLLKKFRQLLIEFHGLWKEKQHAKFLQVMQRLKSAGFKVAHVHGNNYVGVYRNGRFMLPRAIEVTLDASLPLLDKCHDPNYELLDRPNKMGNTDIVGMHTEPTLLEVPVEKAKHWETVWGSELDERVLPLLPLFGGNI